jgi:hypothetical protein
MKNAILALSLLFSFNAFSKDVALVCNDQNSHSVYKLTITQDLQKLQLITVLGDSSVLSAGSKSLRYQEGESAEDSALYAGKLNNGLNVAVHLDAKKATTLRKFDILEVFVQYQAERGANLALSTEFLCSLN